MIESESQYRRENERKLLDKKNEIEQKWMTNAFRLLSLF
jgi:hypothetical protein